MITALASFAPEPEQIPQLTARLTPAQRSLLARVASQSVSLALADLTYDELGYIQGLALLGLVTPLTDEDGQVPHTGYALSVQGAAVIQTLTEEVCR
jgi:hypothetical protein